MIQNKKLKKSDPSNKVLFKDFAAFNEADVDCSVLQKVLGRN